MQRVMRLQAFISRSFCTNVTSSVEKCVKSEVNNSGKTCIKEGKVEVLINEDAFYNPVQEFNRDLSVAVIKEYIKNHSPRNAKCLNSTNADDGSQGSINILEAMAATGLRAIRYAKEIPGIKTVTANDRLESAIEIIKHNVRLNKVDHIVEPSCKDATMLMYENRKTKNPYHVIDLDPYGSPSTLLDAAVQCVSDEGLLLVTCTDMLCLCGHTKGSCHSKYGSLSLRLSSCHEMALRIILRSIELHANCYGRHIIPLLSVSVDFYIRVFVKVHKSPSNANRSIEKLAMVCECTGCATIYLQHLSEINEEGVPMMPQPLPALCEHCGGKFRIGGPIWTGNLHNKDFVNRLLMTLQNEAENYGTGKRMIGVLSVISEELEDCPLYYSLSHLFSTISTDSPSLIKFKSALLNAGYRVSGSHACKDSLKTDAPSDIIWDIVRSWAKQHPTKKDLTGTPGGIILKKNIKRTIDFNRHPEAVPSSRSKRLLRFQKNPMPNWGPKSKVKSKKRTDDLLPKHRDECSPVP